jgi:hypothetical protein
MATYDPYKLIDQVRELLQASGVDPVIVSEKDALVSPGAVSNVQDQDHEPVFLDLVQDAPGTRSYSPRARITHELSGLSRSWIFRQPVNDASGLSPDSRV